MIVALGNNVTILHAHTHTTLLPQAYVALNKSPSQKQRATSVRQLLKKASTSGDRQSAGPSDELSMAASGSSNDILVAEVDAVNTGGNSAADDMADSDVPSVAAVIAPGLATDALAADAAVESRLGADVAIDQEPGITLALVLDAHLGADAAMEPNTGAALQPEVGSGGALDAPSGGAAAPWQPPPGTEDVSAQSLSSQTREQGQVAEHPTHGSGVRT